MLVWSSAENDSRVHKEGVSLASAGYEVTVVCLEASHLPSEESRDGVTYRRVEPAFSPVLSFLIKASHPLTVIARVSPAGKRLLARIDTLRWRLIHRLEALLAFRRVGRSMGEAVKGLRPAVVHAHDLLTLPAAAKLARPLGAALVYDSHELALESLNRPTGLLRLQQSFRERRAIRRADRVLTVSDGIAEHLGRGYGVERPLVLSNAPPARDARRPKRSVRRDARLDEGASLAIYVGAPGTHRGLEALVDAIGLLPGFHLACVGPRSGSWEEDLRARARRRGAEGRLHFLDPVPFEELTDYLAGADVGVIAYENVCLNHEYCMPNKLFECVLAGVPVVVADLHDLRRFVEHNQVGRAVDATDPRALSQALEEVAADDELRPAGERLERLRREYGWEAQGAKLVRLYRGLSG